MSDVVTTDPEIDHSTLKPVEVHTLHELPIATLSNARLITLGSGMLVLWAAMSASILQTAFALPVIAQEYDISDSSAQWVAGSMMLTWAGVFGCSQLVAGSLCDIYGRKRGFLVGAFAHVVLSVLSAVMPNLAGLCVCRALAGISMAIVCPASAGIIGNVYPKGRKRTLAFVAITCGGAAGAAGGELIAGILLEWSRWTWRGCFLLTGIVTIYPLIVGWLLVPSDLPVSKFRAVDWFGAFSVGIALFLLLLTLTISQTSRFGWQTKYLPALLVVSALFFVAFGIRQRQLSRAVTTSGNTKPAPLIPASLISWKRRNILIIYISSFLTWAATDSFFVFASYLYLNVLKLRPFDAGLKLSVTFFSGTAAAVVVALTISTIPPRILMSVGCFISVVTSILFAVRDISWPYWRADIWALLVVAYGTDATIAAGSTLISQSTSPEHQLGYAIGLAISTVIRDTVQRHAEHLGRSDIDGSIMIEAQAAAVLQGLRAAFWSTAGYTALAGIIVLVGSEGWHMLDRKEVGVSEEASVSEK